MIIGGLSAAVSIPDFVVHERVRCGMTKVHMAATYRLDTDYYHRIQYKAGEM